MTMTKNRPSRAASRRSARWRSVAFVVFWIATIVSLPGCQRSGSWRCPPHALALEPGTELPELTVPDLEGRPVSIRELTAGKVAVIDIWASWCRPCLAAIPHLQALQNRYRDLGLLVVGLMVDRNATRIGPAIVEREGIGYKVLTDDSGQALNCAWGFPVGIPTIVLVDREGKVVEVFRGTVGVSAVGRRLEELLRAGANAVARVSARP